MKRGWMIGAASMLALALTGCNLTGAGHTPTGQSALIEMNSQALSHLQAEFNREADSMRVIALLSPT